MTQDIGLLRTRIKICGVTREQDVDAAVQAGVDALGFNMYPSSPRYLRPSRAADLALRLPAFVTPVLLFVNAPVQLVADMLDRVPHAMLQFHGDETPGDCLQASIGGKRPYLRAARIPAGGAGASFDLIEYARLHSQAKAILLDTHVAGYGGGGTVFDWSLLPTSVNAHLVLSGGLTPANVGDGIKAVRPRCISLAVDVSSGVESSKGIKDATKINQFVAAVRTADRQLAQG